MTRPFQIHCICVVKNEADIIELCLKRACEWADHVIIYDGQSTDGTWEKAVDFPSDKVICWKQDGKVFQESLRAEVFNAFRDLSQPGDWWCHLDADEFFVQDPRKFLSAVPACYHVVWGLAIEYYLTQPDVATLDFDQPMETLLEKLRWYTVENSEPRFFRDRARLVWRNDRGWPTHMGVSYPQRIFFKHYKYRTPAQIQRRLDTRRSNVERGFHGWQHARSATWQSTITDPRKLKLDRGDGRWDIDPRKLPDHIGSLPARLLKRFLHGTGIWP